MADSDKKKNGNGEGGLEGELDSKLLNEVDEGLGRLQEKLSDLREQLLSPFEKVEKLAREQKHFGKRAEDEIRKGRTLAFLSLGAAVLALIISGVIAGMGFHLKTGVSRTQEQIAVLGEDLSALKRDMPSADIDKFMAALAANEHRIEILNAQVGELRQKQENLEHPVARLEDLVQSKMVETKTRVTGLEDKLKGVQTKLESLEERKKAPPAVKPHAVWSVNLVSYTKEGYARRVADRYSGRGIPVSVKAVTVDGRTWYRLCVTDFETKEAAEAYAARVEKDLRLPSVWISKN